MFPGKFLLQSVDGTSAGKQLQPIHSTTAMAQPQLIALTLSKTAYIPNARRGIQTAKQCLQPNKKNLNVCNPARQSQGTSTSSGLATAGRSLALGPGKTSTFEEQPRTCQLMIWRPWRTADSASHNRPGSSLRSASTGSPEPS